MLACVEPAPQHRVSCLSAFLRMNGKHFLKRRSDPQAGLLPWLVLSFLCPALEKEHTLLDHIVSSFPENCPTVWHPCSPDRGPRTGPPCCGCCRFPVFHSQKFDHVGTYLNTNFTCVCLCIVHESMVVRRRHQPLWYCDIGSGEPLCGCWD